MTEKHTKTIRFLTWNTELFSITDLFIDGYGNKILDELKKYDVIGFNEVYNFLGTELRDKLVNSLSSEYPYHRYGPGGSTFELNSGLILMSRYEIEDSDTLEYGDDSTGGDKFVNKGALYTRLRVPLEPDGKTHVKVNVFITHTQTDTTVGEDFWTLSWFERAEYKIRSRQIHKLMDFISTHNDGHPMVLMGDLNVVGETEEYNTMMDTFSTFQDLWKAKGDGSPGYTIEKLTDNVHLRRDYVMFRNDGAHTSTTPISCKVVKIYAVYRIEGPQAQGSDLEEVLGYVPGEALEGILGGLTGEELKEKLENISGEDLEGITIDPTMKINILETNHSRVSAEIHFQPSELRRRTFSVDPALALHPANTSAWPMRSLYEYGRFVVLGFRKVLPADQADIRFLLEPPFYWSEGQWQGGMKVPKPGSPLLHHVRLADGTREIYVNPDFNWVPENGGVPLDIDTKTLSLPYALLHMAGHAVGLVDIEDTGAVIGGWDPGRDLQEYTVDVDGEQITSYLTQRDIQGLYLLYGKRPKEKVLPRSAPDISTLEQQVEGMLNNVTHDMQFKIPWGGVQVPRIRVTMTKLRWWGNDDNGVWEDDEVQYNVSVSARTRNGKSLFASPNIIFPGKGDYYEMDQDGDHRDRRHGFIPPTQVLWPDVEEGIYVRLHAHVWEIDGFINGKDDWYGESNMDVLLSFSNHGGHVELYNGKGWAVEFDVTLAGLRDYPNLYNDELDRRNQQKQKKAQFKSAATVSQISEKITSAFAGAQPEVGGQPIEHLQNEIRAIVTNEVEALDCHLLRKL